MNAREVSVIQGTNGHVHLQLFSWADVADQVKNTTDISFLLNGFLEGWFLNR